MNDTREVLQSDQQYRTLIDQSAEAIYLLRALIQASPLAIIVLDPEGNVKMWNPAAERIFGWTEQEVLGRPNPIVPEGKQEEFHALRDRALRGEAITDLELRRQRKDGTLIDVSLSTASMDDAQGKAIGIMALLADITHRKRAEAALAHCQQMEAREREIQVEIQRLKESNENLVQSINEGILIDDADLNILFVNPQMEKLLGYASGELLGRSCIEIFHPQDRSILEQQWSQRQHGQESRYEVRLVAKTGQAVPVLVSARPRYEDGRFVGSLAVFTDLREVKALQAQLLLSQKLSAVGQLVSGLAHELNNPLSGILGLSQLLLHEELPDSLRQDLETIHQQAIRCLKIVQNLLTFARRQKPQKSYVSINEIVRNVLALRAYQLKADNIEVILELDDNLPPTMADYHQMQQVFLNLINNAHQAMVEHNARGRLIIRSEWDKGLIRVKFIDDGSGIPASVLPWIFDPFFTTKEVGKGAGLGLSTSYGIVQEHGGRLYAQSVEGHGATFVVELPVKDDDSHPQDVPEAATSSPEKKWTNRKDG